MPWVPILTTCRLSEGNTWKFSLEILLILTVLLHLKMCYLFPQWVTKSDELGETGKVIGGPVCTLLQYWTMGRDPREDT